MSISNLIAEHALYLGFTKVGFCPAATFDDYILEVEKRGKPYDFLLNRPGQPLRNCQPQLLVPGSRSIVVLALDYATISFPEALNAIMARVYQSRTYGPLPESPAGARLELMKKYLISLGLEATYCPAIPARPAASRANVADIGRNTFAYVPQAGSFIVIYTFLINQELEYGQPATVNRCYKDCQACVNICPTGALEKPFHLNPTKCIGFLQWKTQPASGCNQTSVIPAESRGQMGTTVHGCDLCQTVCPRNRKKIEALYPQDNFLELLSKNLTLSAILKMPEGFYKTRIKPVMHNYLPDPAFFQRNAAIAMGNTLNRAYIPELTEALSNPIAMVRGHVAWALGRLGGPVAKNSLEKVLRQEKDSYVASEVQNALENI